MKLLTKEIRGRIPALYATDEKPEEEREVIVKFFCPWNQWTWYALEGSAVLNEAGEEIDFTFFGYVVGQDKELGYFTLNQLLGPVGPGGLKIERDLHYGEHTLAEVRAKVGIAL